jgi:hypothetical protein
MRRFKSFVFGGLGKPLGIAQVALRLRIGIARSIAQDAHALSDQQKQGCLRTEY